MEKKEVTDFQKNLLHVVKERVMSICDKVPSRQRRIVREACIEALEELARIEKWK